MDVEIGDTCSINNLPSEIISLILLNNNCCEIMRFGLTCRKFYDMVCNDRILWKGKFKHLLTAEIAELVEEHCNSNWITEIKRYLTLKKDIHSLLISMSAQYYWTTDVSLQDVSNFFRIALSHNLSYYYTICTLQEVIKQGIKNLEKWTSEKPFTLTEMHYAKVALRHLIHSFLAVKWVKMHVKKELTPEIVVNFFLQWIDTNNLYPDNDVKIKIQELVKKVETILSNTHVSKSNSNTIQEQCAKGLIKESEILAAINQVIYHQRHVAITTTANIETLNIIKVIDHKCGNAIAIGAIYQAVAKTFGVNCDLVSFPNHLFLEWRDSSNISYPKIYTIDISTGDIQPKRRCPFSQGGPVNRYKYYPDSLLQYTYSTFHITMGAIKNWHTQNSLHLLDFLGSDDNEYNPYRNFFNYLLGLSHLPAMNIQLNLKYINQTHMKIIDSLSHLNAALNTVSRSVVVKTRDSRVKYAVGMICYHRIYDYVCVIRGWDLSCAVEWQRRMEIDGLEFGAKQPFYHVIAADQSERYVAQENLTDVKRPSRLYHLEDIIAREFTHFDKFGYVLNDEKRAEYPNDDAIFNVYRNQCPLVN